MRSTPAKLAGAISRAQHPCAAPVRSTRAQYLAAGVGAGLNQRSEPDGGVERGLLLRRGDEAVGVLLQHSDWAQQSLDEIDTVTRLRHERAVMPSERVPPAAFPRSMPPRHPW